MPRGKESLKTTENNSMESHNQHNYTQISVFQPLQKINQTIFKIVKNSLYLNFRQNIRPSEFLLKHIQINHFKDNFGIWCKQVEKKDRQIKTKESKYKKCKLNNLHKEKEGTFYNNSHPTNQDLAWEIFISRRIQWKKEAQKVKQEWGTSNQSVLTLSVKHVGLVRDFTP